MTLTLNRKFLPERRSILPIAIFFLPGPSMHFLIINSDGLVTAQLLLNPFMPKETYQGTAVLNYCDESVKHTRITEHKHFTAMGKTSKNNMF